MNIWTFIIRASWAAIAILSVILVIGVFGPKVQQMRDLQTRESQLREEVKLEQEMLRHLQMKQERLRSDPRFVEKIAREELGLAKPGETVFKFMDDAPATNARPSRP